MTERWDIFCRVVDNFGDIGVCARLARQLCDEHARPVRLWVDDLASFQAICPEVAPRASVQHIGGVEVRHWREDTVFSDASRVVIEAFGCGLPAGYAALMASDTRWVVLEYLSAETWVAGCHLRGGQSAGAPVPRVFFFPGFDAGSGGLLRERGLLSARSAFEARGLQHPVWAGAREDALRVTMFCYDNPALPALLEAFAQSSQAVCCAVPAGAVANRVCTALAQPVPASGGGLDVGALQIRVFKFLPQPDYDPLLWSAHCNFVRGEDSFVRAQWAARPMVWQLYPQAEDAHLTKLEAFLDRYCQGMAGEAAHAARAMFRGWNTGGLQPQDWSRFAAALPALREHAKRWCDALAAQRDLTDQLVQFCDKSL